MTVSDLINCLKSYVEGTGYRFRVGSTAQVKIGKHINDQKDVWDFFDVIRVNKDLVLVPSDKWDRNGLEKKK